MKHNPMFAKFTVVVTFLILLVACATHSNQSSEEGGIGGTGNAEYCSNAAEQPKAECDEQERP